MKSANPRFYENAGGIVDCDDCPFNDGGERASELCNLNDCPTKGTYADAVALAEGEPNH